MVDNKTKLKISLLILLAVIGLGENVYADSTVSVATTSVYRVTSGDTSQLNAPWYEVDVQIPACPIAGGNTVPDPCGSLVNMTLFGQNLPENDDNLSGSSIDMWRIGLGSTAIAMRHANSTIVESGPARVHLRFENKTGDFCNSGVCLNWTADIFAYPRYFLYYFTFASNGSFALNQSNAADNDGFNAYSWGRTALNNPKFDIWNNRTINGTAYLNSTDVNDGADIYRSNVSSSLIFLYDDADHNRTVLVGTTVNNFTGSINNRIFQTGNENMGVAFEGTTDQGTSSRELGYIMMFGVKANSSSGGVAQAIDNQTVWNNNFNDQYSDWYNPASVTAITGTYQSRSNITGTYNFTASSNKLDFNFTTGNYNRTLPVFHITSLSNITNVKNYIYWKNYTNTSSWTQLNNGTDILLQEGNSTYFGYDYILMMVNYTLVNTSQTYEFWVSNSSEPVPPQWQQNTTNSTLAGLPILFSVNWVDNVGLSGYIFSFDNGTGSFINDSSISWTRPNNYSTAGTGTVNNPTNAFDQNFNDTSTFANLTTPAGLSSSLFINFSSTFPNATLYWTWNGTNNFNIPKISILNISGNWIDFGNVQTSVTTNSTIINSTYIQPNNVIAIRFLAQGSGCCSENMFVYDVYLSPINERWSNVTKVINSTTGSTIRWRVYANDSSNNWNTTNTFSFSVSTTPLPPNIRITNYFSCSYYNSNFTALVYSGPSNQYLSTCFIDSSADYTFNITSNSLQKIIIPLASGTCDVLVGKYSEIISKGQPNVSFSTYSGISSDPYNLQLKLNYPNIIITGDGNSIGTGNSRLCIKKIGVQNNLPVVYISRC